MTTDPHSPEVLTSVANEVQAAALVAALEVRGVHATTTGGFTAGFRAEAPGQVNIIVRRQDLPRAKERLAEIRQEVQRRQDQLLSRDEGEREEG